MEVKINFSNLTLIESTSMLISNYAIRVPLSPPPPFPPQLQKQISPSNDTPGWSKEMIPLRRPFEKNYEKREHS